MTQEISAFSAGFLSFLAPCVLPLIPSYIAWISGASLKDDSDIKGIRIRIFIHSILLILSFSIVFVILGASASFLGQTLAPYRLLVQRIGGLIIILFGLEFIGLFRKYRISLAKRLFTRISHKTGSLLVGLTFAFAWVACFSPILGSILVLSSFQNTLTQGVILLSFYSAGLAVPFLLTSLFIGFITKKIKVFMKIARWINLFSGSILIILGILLFFDKFYKIVILLSKLY